MRIVIFGGTGFIGVHYANHLLETYVVDKLILVDLKGFGERYIPPALKNAIDIGIVELRIADVRNSISQDFCANQVVDLIANFAAVHREPGHDDFEYFETNLLGAENVCKFAESVSCNNIVFTSSISPYGPCEIEKSEKDIPVPTTAYGSSKLVAEKIHLMWQAKAPNDRFLTIVRPGVVFGPGEGGNVSRLIRAVLGGYFVFMGNKDVRKAGVYVKELCNALEWVRASQKTNQKNVYLFNMTMNPGPSVLEYVHAIQDVAGSHKFIPYVPSVLIMFAARFISTVLGLVRIKHPFHPRRIQKMVRSNNIRPLVLIDDNYIYKYTLAQALADWKSELPSEW